MQLHCWQVPMRTRFRGITTREGMLVRGAAGWAEWSPFTEYDDAEAANWWAAAREAAETGFPAPVRDRVAVNVTVPAVDFAQAHAIVSASSCRTAKVKVAERGQHLSDDLDRIEAVRDAIGPRGRIRVDANGGWDVETAVDALKQLGRFGLEYAEQPCASVEELAQLRRELARRGIDVPIAADESIRRAADPQRVVELEAADVAVLKVQPLGGVRRCLELAEQLGLPVVVSSALETSVGIRMGVALAAALPELPHACGLNTLALFADDVAAVPLVATDGSLLVRDVLVDGDALARLAAPSDREQWWTQRLARVREVCA
ncbi:o-succinylbenzoate synthase [Luteococcus sanguinis]|uniref:o-succinylbenzoate synthase n=1 Tax=Luteococcus sanguinis TaxID=174038 RepID=A0ABW1X281_9ACTN